MMLKLFFFFFFDKSKKCPQQKKVLNTKQRTKQLQINNETMNLQNINKTRKKPQDQ